MAIRLPPGSASSFISLAAGGIAASAVALAWLPLLTESSQREVEQETRHLQALAQLATREAPSAGPQRLETFRVAAGLHGVWVANDSGLVVSSSAQDALDDTILQGMNQACAPPGEPARVPVSWIHEDQVHRLACQTVADPPLRVAVSSPSDTAGPLADARRRATSLLLGLGAVVALIVIAGIRWLLRPIQTISHAARAIAQGQRQVRVPVDGPEEIDQLARAVNTLASSVETREDEIRGRLEVVNEISSMVAHEVRNSLQSLELLASLAATEPDPAGREQLLTTMRQEIRGLEGVVQRVLRSSGPLRIAPASADLVAIVRRATTLTEPEARSRGVSMLVQAPGVLRAEVDGSLVRRAFENLLLNAIEFAAQAPPGQVSASVRRQGDRIVLTVEDDGPGVPAGEIDRIFQPYYSSKAGGTGLGLSLCRQVFDAHGGAIRYGPSYLGGARFIAELPQVATAADLHRPSPP